MIQHQYEREEEQCSFSLFLFDTLISKIIKEVQWFKFCSPSVLSAVAEQFNHVWEKEPPNLHQLGAGGGVLQWGGYHLENHCTQTQTHTHTHSVNFTREQSTLERIKLNVTYYTLTWVLNLDSGVGLRMRFVNYLCAHLLCQNLETVRRHRSHILCEENIIFGYVRGESAPLPRTECCRWSRSQC